MKETVTDKELKRIRELLEELVAMQRRIYEATYATAR